MAEGSAAAAETDWRRILQLLLLPWTPWEQSPVRRTERKSSMAERSAAAAEESFQC